MKGFTLVETIVVVAIISLVTGAIASSIVTFYRGNAYLLEQNAALDSARKGVFEAARVLREASYGDDGAYPILVAGTSSITFFSDVDNDRSVERIRYVLIGQTLFQTMTNATGSPPTYPTAVSATTTVATNVMNGALPIFTYLDENGAVLSSTSTPIARIRSIRVRLLVDLNPTRAPNVFDLSQSATLRNIR